MKFCLFHLMPYAPLDLTFDEKHPTVLGDAAEQLLRSQAGPRLYNRYLDELELADQLGFDGVCVNEHHQTAYGLMPMPGRDGRRAVAPHQERARSPCSAARCRCSTIRSASPRNTRCSTTSPAAG